MMSFCLCTPGKWAWIHRCAVCICVHTPSSLSAAFFVFLVLCQALNWASSPALGALQTRCVLTRIKKLKMAPGHSETLWLTSLKSSTCAYHFIMKIKFHTHPTQGSACRCSVTISRSPKPVTLVPRKPMTCLQHIQLLPWLQMPPKS